MPTTRDFIVEKLSAYLRGDLTDTQIYEWAVGLAVSQYFEETISKDPLLQATVQNFLDMRRPDIQKTALKAELEYCRRCLAGEETFVPLALRKEAKNSKKPVKATVKSSPNPLPVVDVPPEIPVSKPDPNPVLPAEVHLVETPTERSISRGWLLFFRVYSGIFAFCSLSLHMLTILQPQLLASLEIQTDPSNAATQSLPYIIYAVFVLLPPRWLSMGIFFYVSALVLLAGMAGYWFIAISLLLKMHLHILFVLAILPFSAIPATLAFILLVYSRKKDSCLIQKKSGFTLLEIVISVILVGVVAALALVGYNRVLIIAKQRDALLQLRTIYVANEMYHAKAGGFCYSGVYDTTYINNQVNNLFSLTIPLDNSIQLYYANWCGYDAMFTFGTAGVSPGWWRIAVTKNSSTEAAVYDCQGNCLIDVSGL